MGSITENFDYKSLKELLKDTKADILTPDDGQKYEDIIQRWSESCVKRAVCRFSFFALLYHPHTESELGCEDCMH